MSRCASTLAVLTVVAASATGTGCFPAQNTESIERDLDAIVSGNFSPDAIGEQEYQAVIQRTRKRSSSCLKVFESRYLGEGFDAVRQADLYLPSFLELLREQQPQRVRTFAHRLRKLYDAVLILYDHAPDKAALFATVPDETARLIQRIAVRRAELLVLERPE